MPAERDNDGENPYESPAHDELKRHSSRLPWWLRQPEVSLGGGGFFLFLLLAGALLIYNALKRP